MNYYMDKNLDVLISHWPAPEAKLGEIFNFFEELSPSSYFYLLRLRSCALSGLSAQSPTFF